MMLEEYKITSMVMKSTLSKYKTKVMKVKTNW